MATKINPFQNNLLEPLTQMDDTKQSCLQQKFEELIVLDATMRKTLTLEECAAIAGGFGATDDSVVEILKEGMSRENTKNKNGKSNNLESIITVGLASAVRSGDYYIARQLLILYSHVASQSDSAKTSDSCLSKNSLNESAFSISDLTLLQEDSVGDSRAYPPSFETERLRSAVSI